MNTLDPKFTKAVSSSLTVQAETLTEQVIYDTDLLFTLCDRDTTTDNKGNFFMSFNLPTSESLLGTGTTIAKYFPELFQLNVDQVVFATIPSTAYSEYIDGRSIKLLVPTGGTSPNLGVITMYSSTYSSDKPLKYGESNVLLGDNICFLFSDNINKPYTGYTANELGIRTNHSGNTTWEPDSTDYTQRPSAVSYREVYGGGPSALNSFNRPNGLNTDTRTGWFSVTTPSSYPDNIAGYNYDVPVGFCILDKGICVITHTAITTNILWSAGVSAVGGDVSTNSGRTFVYFTGYTGGASDKAARLEFTDINTSFKTTAVCLAMPTEFWISNNPTWDRSSALNNLNSQTGILTINPVQVTEVGLYNRMNELVAVAKMSEYVEKTYVNLVTFNLSIDM